MTLTCQAPWQIYYQRLLAPNMPKPFVITGPSGVGKTAVVDGLLASLPNAHRVVTCTTRDKREGEVDGVHYHFLDHATFQSLIDNGQMFEWDEHYGHLYGIRRADVDSAIAQPGVTIITIDTAGAKTIKNLWKEAVVIFLTAESADVLSTRIRERGNTSSADLQTRLDRLEEELAFGKTADYSLLNAQGKLTKTIEEVAAVIAQELTK